MRECDRTWQGPRHFEIPKRRDLLEGFVSRNRVQTSKNPRVLRRARQRHKDPLEAEQKYYSEGACSQFNVHGVGKRLLNLVQSSNIAIRDLSAPRTFAMQI